MTHTDRASDKNDLQAEVIRYRLRYSPQGAFAATRPDSMVKVLETKPATTPLTTRPKPFHAIVVAVVALAAATPFAASPSAAVAQPRPATTCSRGPALASACQLITTFFQALNRGDEARACSLLGVRLLSETGASNCPSLVALSQGTPFKIIRARGVGTTVLVRLKVGLHELDHWRMLNWIAVVGPEGGTLKILDTKRVA